MKVWLILISILLSSGSMGIEGGENDSSLIDFDSVREVLKKDLLTEELRKKQKEEAEEKSKELTEKKQKYNYPTEEDFWPFLSELWLVKNAPKLKWDFQKPDYGLDESFKILLETLGFYEKKFKILLLDTTTVQHFALPYKRNEYLLLLSVPYIRTMDLTKLEISIQLLEDMFRAEGEYVKKYVQKGAPLDKLGTNFFGAEMDVSFVIQALKRISERAYEKGYNFKQQFEVTKQVADLLKGNVKLWSAYHTLLTKKDHLVKHNHLYKNYIKLYPSPELQINWLTPKAKKF